jgi:hypothetical protein
MAIASRNCAVSRPDPADVELRPLSERRLGPYLDFASRAFGPRSYQADERYIRWLYDESPHGALSDCALVASGERIVGCLHKLRLTWRIGQADAPVATVHNLFVDPDHRGGLGATLVLAAMRGETAIFVPGAAGAAGFIYERLRWPEIHCQWHRRVWKSPLGLLRAAGNASVVYSDAGQDDLRLTFHPDEDTIGACLAALNDTAGESARPIWTRETFGWRFLHPLGPRHLLASSGSRSFAIFSCGVRRGVRMARLIDAAFDDRDRIVALLRWTTRLLARRGVMVSWSYSSRELLNAAVADLRWTAMAQPPRSFLFRRRAGAPHSTAINASAGDFGFESIRDHR